MGGPLVGSNAEGVSSSSCLCPSTCEKAGFEHSSCACPEDEKLKAKIACAQDDLVVEEIGLALAKVMQGYDDNDDEVTGQSEDSDENEDPLSLDSDSTNDLVDVETELVTSSTSLNGNASESSIGKSEDGNSLNITPVLVSAMKGSRAKRGIVANLSVSWAPDVYDPPVTSDSHTMRPHHRSSRKSHYKYKPPKGSSSSRSSSGSKKDKKHSHHSSSSGSSSKREKKSSHRSTNSGSSRTDTSDLQHRKAYGSSISSRTDTSDPQHGKASGSSSSISSRTDTSDPQHGKASGSSSISSRNDSTVVREYDNLSLWLPPDSAKMEEAVPPVPVLKSMEQIKRSVSSCKEPPLSMLSRQVSTKYKGIFSFWGQNQLAS